MIHDRQKRTHQTDDITAQLDKLYSYLQERTQHHIGYPINTDFDYSDLERFYSFHLNNVGDPFEFTNYQINTKTLEKEVIEFIESRFSIPKNEGWGYATSGGTEGNLYGLFLGREHYPDALLYYSDQTHYSIGKIARILNIPRIKIPSLYNGEINYDQLEKELYKHSDKAAIINVNYGTTVKGAIDDIEHIVSILDSMGKKQYYIHADAALFGLMLSYIKKAPQIRLTDLHDHVNSLAISGHKFIGTPVPCGIAITTKKLVKKVERNIEYLESTDTTVAGSRSGLAVLYLWYAIRKKGNSVFKTDAEDCISRAEYLFHQLEKANYPSFLNPYSNIVLLKKPSEDIIHKWQLATQGTWAHAIIMPSVTKHKIDLFLDDII